MDIRMRPRVRRSASEGSPVLGFVVVGVETAAPLTVRHHLPIRASMVPTTDNRLLAARRTGSFALCLRMCLCVQLVRHLVRIRLVDARRHEQMLLALYFGRVIRVLVWVR